MSSSFDASDPRWQEIHRAVERSRRIIDRSRTAVQEARRNLDGARANLQHAKQVVAECVAQPPIGVITAKSGSAPDAKPAPASDPSAIRPPRMRKRTAP